MAKTSTVPLRAPTIPTGTSADRAATGLYVPPIDRIKIFSPSQWEDFTLEWVDSIRATYSSVDKCAGAGDMGRDIVANCKGGNGAWHNYQCKHYPARLTPGEIWTELGKLAYYTYRGEYTYPERYFFVAPQGAGNKLSKLLCKPAALRDGLFSQWDEKCREKITSTTTVELDAALRTYIAGLDFSIFEAIPVLRLLDGHRSTPWHIHRFGGGLPDRPEIPPVPADPTDSEAKYVRQLLDAYGDHLKKPIAGVGDLAQDKNIQDHFGQARLEFYSAESLRAFSRDNLPAGEFEKLQADVHSGIGDEIREPHADGYRRVLSVVRMARTLQLDAHALNIRLGVKDRGGICHQLANDEKVRWVT
jgi:hypothetical protein